MAKFKLNKIFKKTTALVLVFAMLIPVGFSTVAYAADAATISAYVKTLNTYRTEIYKLINECAKKGIPTDYEYVVYSILNRWRTNELVKPKDSTEGAAFEDFYYNRNPENYFENYLKPALDSMYQEAKANLEGYLAGTKKAKDVPKFVTSEMQIDGYTVTADTVNTAGNKERRPVYFVGYGAFDDAKDTIPQFQKFGANTVQNEVGPDSLLTTSMPWARTQDAQKGIVDFADDVYTSAPYSFKLSKTGSHSSGTEIKLWQTINVENNATYTFSFMAKADNVSGASYLINNKSFAIDGGTYDWKEYSYTFSTDATQLVTQVSFGTNNVCGWLYIDDVKLIKNGTTTNAVSDGNFDEYKPSPDRKYYVNIHGTKRTHELLASAQNYDIAISLLLSPHYFPKFFKNLYPDLYINDRPIINHPKYAEIIEAYLAELLTQIKDYKSLNNICVTNEPQFFAENFGDYYKPQWIEWLKEKYKDSLETLNSAYQASYTNWDQVPISTIGGTTVGNADNMEFNRYIYSKWHRWLAYTVKKYIPDVPVHAKAQGYAGSFIYDTHLRYGTAYEYFNEWSDLAGCDYSIEWLGVDNGTHSHLGASMWYDYLAGVGEKPVINSEDHIYVDEEENFNFYQALHMGAAMWQGAVHHRSFSNVWVWRKSYSNTGNIYYGSLMFRPDCIKAIGEASLDLNRLSYEVDALVNAPEDIAVLYSDATRLLSPRSHMEVMYNAYEAMLFNGKKVRIVSDIQAEKINKCKYLVIPKVTNASKKVVNEIYSYAQNGGKIIILDNSSLKKDEFGKDHTGETLDKINSIYSGATVMTSYGKSTLYSSFETYLKNNNLQKIWLVDSQTGEKLPHTEWTYAEYNGQLLINVCNYDYYTPLNAKLVIDGKTVSGVKELRSGNVLGESFTLNPYKSVLLSVPMDKPADIQNLKVTKNGTTVNLEWTDKSTNTTGYNIYKLNGKCLEFVKAVDTKNAVLENVSESFATFIIKAKTALGAEADGVSFTVSQSPCLTVSGSAELRDKEVLYNVTVQCNESANSSGIITALLKNENGTIIGASMVSKLLYNGDSHSFKGAIMNPDLNARYIEFVVLDSVFNGYEISNRQVIDLK